MTSYTVSTLIDNERHNTLCDGLIRLCIQLRPLDCPPAVMRTDPATGFTALTSDPILHQHRISLEIRHVKNPNKNPVAENAVQELDQELLQQEPQGGTVTPVVLAIATAALNSRTRTRGLSAREMWTQRDQFSNHQIPMSDQDLISKQHLVNRSNSAKSKAPLGKLPRHSTINIGDLVYLHDDRSKLHARDRYSVVSTDAEWLNIHRFTAPS